MFSFLYFILLMFSLWVNIIIIKIVNKKELSEKSFKIKEYKKTVNVEKIEDNEEYLNIIKINNQEIINNNPKLKYKLKITPK